jgi:hypothetical protein
MIRLSLLALILFAVTPAQAQQAPSRADQLACRSDALKYCGSHVGKPPEMNACLVQNKSKLSGECRTVVEARGG